MMQGAAQAVDRVVTCIRRVVKEMVMMFLLSPFLDNFHAVREDHVVDALIGGPRHLGGFAYDVEIFLESADPIFAAKLVAVLSLRDDRNDFTSINHRNAPGHDTGPRSDGGRRDAVPLCGSGYIRGC